MLLRGIKKKKKSNYIFVTRPLNCTNFICWNEWNMIKLTNIICRCTCKWEKPIGCYLPSSLILHKTPPPQWMNKVSMQYMIQKTEEWKFFNHPSRIKYNWAIGANVPPLLIFPERGRSNGFSLTTLSSTAPKTKIIPKFLKYVLNLLGNVSTEGW